jgi:ABC-type Fe3+-siderophore transport system permease subunit
MSIKGFHQNRNNLSFPNIFGISEVVGATILLVISVALSLLIFGYFHSYISELDNALINTLNKHCEFEVMSAVANTSGSTITSLSIVLYNYGRVACPISGVFLLNGSAIYPIKVSSNCVTSPITILNPGQVEILNYTGLNIPYYNYEVRVVSCDGFIAEGRLG